MTKDSLIVLTPLQLKKTNLIFVEHSLMKEKIPNLENIISLQDSTIFILQQNSKKQFEQIQNFEKYALEQQQITEQLNKDLKKKSRNNVIYKSLAIGGCAVAVGVIITLICTNGK